MRAVSAGQAGAADHGPDAPAVRYSLLQRGHHRQARPRRVSNMTSIAALRRAWTRSARKRVRRGRRRHAAVPRRPHRGTGGRLASADGRGCRRRTLRAGRPAARCHADGPDAGGPASKDGRARLSARDVFGLKLGPAGAVVQVFLVRGGRVVDARELVTEAAEGPMTGEADMVAAAIAQFYRGPRAPPEVHVPVAPVEAEGSKPGCARRPQGANQVPKRGEKRGLLDLASRNAALAYEGRFNAETPAQLQRARDPAASWRCPHCRGASTASTSRRFRAATPWPSMVVCEDGRMKSERSTRSSTRSKAWPGPAPGRAPRTAHPEPRARREVFG